MSNFARSYESDDGSTVLSHLDGVPWHEAPIPSRWHRCRVQSCGFTNYFTIIERCACGAIRVDCARWMQRNSRRKK